jgi:hypothetical protein
LSEDDNDEYEYTFSSEVLLFSPLTSIEDWSVILREEDNLVEFTTTLLSVEELFKKLYPKCKRTCDFEEHDQGTLKKYKESG